MSSKYPGGIIATGADTGYSVAFDGTGDYLTLATNQTPLLLSNSDWTVEAWVYLTATAARSTVFTGQSDQATGAGSSYFFAVGTSGTIDIWSGSSNYGIDVVNPRLYTWAHIAYVRTGGTLSSYLNGTRISTRSDLSTLSINNGSTSYPPQIGADGTGKLLTGYISNLRLIKGSGGYNATQSTITVPTQLFPTANTSLLACQSPTLIDNSTNNFTLTVNGNAAVSNFTPFAGYKGFNPAMGSAASGIWSIEEATNYQSNREWPIYDPYFNKNTLLIHGNGTNGANNNSFIDSSSNNFAITKNGNTTQGTFSPYSPSGFSYRLNGTSDGIYIPSSVMSGSWVNSNFTLETWLYLERDRGWLLGRNNNDTLYIDLDTETGTINYGSFNGISFSYTFSSSPRLFNNNEWFHLAFVRDSSSTNTNAMRIFVNGVLVGIGNTGTFGVDNNSFFMNDRIGNSNNLRGYCAGLRITKRALYRENFVPPQQLTAIDNTLLLTCNSNQLVDTGPNRYTVTTITSEGEGNQTLPDVTPFTPFVPSYITPTSYSNYFDGTGDYLSVPDSANLEVGSSSFTVEAWVYATANQANGSAVISKAASSSYSPFMLALSGAGSMNFYCSTAGSTWDITTGDSATFPLNKWVHVAGVRNGTTFTLYINGTAVGTPATSSSALWNNTETLKVGWINYASSYWVGCISNARLVIGSAVYTTNFTPPSAPLTAITNTQFLSCQDSTIKDNSPNNFTITANGDVRPVSSPTPYPPKVDQSSYKAAYDPLTHGGSAYFDGTSDYLSVASGSSLNLGTNDFTMDLWWYPTAFSADGEIFHGTNATFAFYNSSTGGEVQAYIGTGTSGGWNILSAGVIGTAKLNQWNHLAITRSGTAFRTFLNGIPGATATSSSSITSNNTFVGARAGPAGVVASCYISGVRILSGTALYTSAFAPPIAPPTPVTNTSLLLNFTNAAVIDNSGKHNLEGEAKISTAVSKFGGSSLEFDGSGDWLIADKNSPLLTFGAEDFTIEMWINPRQLRTTDPFLNGTTNSLYFTYDSGLRLGTYNVDWQAGGSAADGVPTNNTWNHIAVTRANSVVRFFVNGNHTTTTTGVTKNYTAPSYSIMGDSAGAGSFNGYVQDFRVTKGYARYTGNFTPQTSVWQNQ